MLASPGMAAIHVEGLVTRFGTLLAVDGLSFEVREGERLGVLGPNSAGKTILINILSTLLRPTAGHAEEFAGFSVLECPAPHAAVYHLPRAERRAMTAQTLALDAPLSLLNDLLRLHGPTLRSRCRFTPVQTRWSLVAGGGSV